MTKRSEDLMKMHAHLIIEDCREHYAEILNVPSIREKAIFRAMIAEVMVVSEYKVEQEVVDMLENTILVLKKLKHSTNKNHKKRLEGVERLEKQVHEIYRQLGRYRHTFR